MLRKKSLFVIPALLFLFACQNPVVEEESTKHDDATNQEVMQVSQQISGVVNYYAGAELTGQTPNPSLLSAETGPLMSVSTLSEDLDVTVSDGNGGTMTIKGNATMIGEPGKTSYDFNLTITCDNFTYNGITLNGGPLKYSYKGYIQQNGDVMITNVKQTMSGNISVSAYGGPVKNIKYGGSADIYLKGTSSSIQIKITYNGFVNINGKQIDYKNEVYEASVSL